MQNQYDYQHHEDTIFSFSMQTQYVDDEEVNQEVPETKVVKATSPQTPVNRQPRQRAPPRPKTTNDHNWQANFATLRERNAAMFNNELMADICFIVGQKPHIQRIPAHKYVLATGSSVFYAMFYGGLANTERDIEIPDVEPAAFLSMLK